jgi:predicted adenylyl cyclase CyaB
LADLDRPRQVARRLATEPPETQHQVDTYFHCRNGRLKLREIIGQRAELIWYERPDRKQAKSSRYGIVPVEDAEALKQALSASLGVRTVVEKQREIYLHKNVRIHLDRVVDLGTFIEFEAVLGADVDEETGYGQVEFLQRQFEIRDEDLLTGSYAEMREAGK